MHQIPITQADAIRINMDDFVARHMPIARLSDQPTVTLADLRARLTGLRLIHRTEQIRLVRHWLCAAGGLQRAGAAVDLRSTDFPAWRVDQDNLAEMLDELTAIDAKAYRDWFARL